MKTQECKQGLRHVSSPVYQVQLNCAKKGPTSSVKKKMKFIYLASFQLSTLCVTYKPSKKNFWGGKIWDNHFALHYNMGGHVVSGASLHKECYCTL